MDQPKEDLLKPVENQPGKNSQKDVNKARVIKTNDMLFMWKKAKRIRSISLRMAYI